MYDKKTLYRKMAGIAVIAFSMAGLVYAYDTYGAPVDRALHVTLNTLSPAHQLKYAGAAAEFARYEKRNPPSAPATGSAQGVPVLLYHGIVPRPDRFNMTVATFRDQMFALKTAGYRTISMADFIAFMKEGKQLPAKSFLLTFDDGRRDSYVNADPVLKAVGFRATMFVAVEDSMRGNQESYYIAPDDIRDMIASGRWDIGSHAIQETGGFVAIGPDRRKGNFLSNKAWLAAQGRLETDQEFEARLTRELAGSKRELEGFGITVDAFAYPFGDYGNQTRDAEGATGTVEALVDGTYRVAFRQVWPNDGEFELNYPDTDPLHLKRVETPTDRSGAELVRFFDEAEDKSLPYADPLTVDNGWMQLWGAEKLDDAGGLDLAATATSTGAAALLDGTKTWKDYAYTATVDRLGGAYVSVMARYVDGRNYLVCTYGEGRVKIENVVDGQPQKLAEDADPYDLPDRGAELGIRVSGDTAQCLVGIIPVLTSAVPDGSGGIGLRVWDPELGEAAVRLRAISAVPISD